MLRVLLVRCWAGRFGYMRWLHLWSSWAMTLTDNFLPLHWHHNYSSSCSKQTDLKEPCVKWAKLCSALNRDAVSLGPKNDKTWGKPMENPQKIDEQLRQRSERPDGENLWTADQEWGSGLAPYIKLISFKKDETHEPECSRVCEWYRCQNTWLCSHAQYLSAIVYLNSLVHVSLVTCLQCGVESVECGVWSKECGV